MRYALIGYGRMGRAIDEQAASRGHERLLATSAPDWSARELARAEMVYEFSTPESAEANLLRLHEAGLSVVCGTTGWTPSAELESRLGDGSIGCLIAANLSVGMNLFYRVVARAGRLFAAAGLHDPYVLELHHRAKRDVPSGTARRLGQILLEVDPSLSGVDEGTPEGARPRERLSVVSVRAGAEPGTHVVAWDGEHDRIRLEHSARSRAGFALGAVIAGEWLCGRRGRFGFDDVLEDLEGET